MTENEAITTEIEYSQPCDIICKDGADCNDCRSYHRQLAEWLEELKQYRTIGTVEECREAAEKQKAKKPDYEGDGYSDGQLVYDTWICPCCGQHYEVDYDDYYYCPECGQHIDKSMEQEGER
jgi:hypothetical protein